MGNIFEVPKYVRYDFLITVLGILSISVWWYFTFVREIKSEILGLLPVSGIWFLIWGFGEMYSNYREERDLSQLRGIVEKKALFNQLIKYKIVDKDQTKFFMDLLKEDIKDIIEKKKENKEKVKKDY